MSAGDPREHDAPDGTESEQEASFDAEALMGEQSLSRADQNGDTRLRV